MESSSSSILIVDDNSKNVQILANLLSKYEYNIEYATNGYEALHWSQNENFDLILLDVMMPDMDGYEVCKQLKSNTKTKDIPVIFLTAKNDVESITNGFQCGGVDYITKPFNSDELIARVKTHLELKNSREQLKNINQWLEKEVAIRTEELKNANDELDKAKREIEVLDHTKTEFLHLISHEIRTPLNGILGFTNILKTLESSEKVKECVSYLDISVQRLERFSLQALDVSNIRLKGKKALIYQKLNFNTLLQENISKLFHEFDNRNIKLQYSFFPGNYLMDGDLNRLEEAFYNIFHNLLFFFPLGESILIELTENNEVLNCKIIDKGPGLSRNNISDLYDSFKMVHNNISTQNGLSLYYSKLIIESHSGYITIENNEDNETFLMITLPVHFTK